MQLIEVLPDQTCTTSENMPPLVRGVVATTNPVEESPAVIEDSRLYYVREISKWMQASVADSKQILTFYVESLAKALLYTPLEERDRVHSVWDRLPAESATSTERRLNALIDWVSNLNAWLEEETEALSPEAVDPLTSGVSKELAAVPSPPKEAIREILNQFVNAVASSNITETELPPLCLSLLEDSSYLLEWTFADRRLGFSFEPSEKDSGWYLVLSNASAERFESGSMNQLELERLVGVMLKA